MHSTALIHPLTPTLNLAAGAPEQKGEHHLCSCNTAVSGPHGHALRCIVQAPKSVFAEFCMGA
jgi:hypothetical protein